MGGEMIEKMHPEPEDLVDVFYVPFVGPLGNLVILFAQAEAAWLQLVAELTGCTEKEAPNRSSTPKDSTGHTCSPKWPAARNLFSLNLAPADSSNCRE